MRRRIMLHERHKPFVFALPFQPSPVRCLLLSVRLRQSMLTLGYFVDDTPRYAGENQAATASDDKLSQRHEAGNDSSADKMVGHCFTAPSKASANETSNLVSRNFNDYEVRLYFMKYLLLPALDEQQMTSARQLAAKQASAPAWQEYPPSNRIAACCGISAAIAANDLAFAEKARKIASINAGGASITIFTGAVDFVSRGMASAVNAAIKAQRYE